MFAKRLRDMGTKMFIYPNVDIVHWGYKEFAGNFHKFLKNEKFVNEKMLEDNTKVGQRFAAG